MDHDRLFKELLANFFVEFVDLFLPNVSAFLDRDTAAVALDKEVFTDLTQGERHEVDLVMKVKFRFTVIQLNRLPWRRFADQPNPVAGALMANMRMAARDRPRVKLECLRLLARLKLDPARSKLIGGFIDSYLTLTAQEMKQYEREFAKLATEEKQMASVLVSSWERRGITQGKEELVVRQIRRRSRRPDGAAGSSVVGAVGRSAGGAAGLHAAKRSGAVAVGTLTAADCVQWMC